MRDKTLVERLRDNGDYRTCRMSRALGTECNKDRFCSQCFDALADAIEHEYLPRPRLLDAEKVPINVGDTVWHINTGECRTVDEVGDFWICSDGYAVKLNPLMYSHKQPDSLERIEEDATMPPRKYVADRRHDVGLMDDEECACWMCTDLLRRQREVLERDSRG